jgi:hypothetical protein
MEGGRDLQYLTIEGCACIILPKHMRTGILGRFFPEVQTEEHVAVICSYAGTVASCDHRKFVCLSRPPLLLFYEWWWINRDQMR